MRTVPTICVVDDDENVRDSLDSLLRSVGMKVCTFPSAEDFISYTGRTDCLITDLNMDGMDGLDLQAVLRQRGCTFPIILMTAFPTPGVRNRSLDLGATAFLTKPLDPEDLLNSVESAVEPSRH
ncbi:response regulator transcription factor [Azospirillum canadense]|uniref:response regulator transcription factor n=1 Tax=Azospirillum canadense TaxID=403962 RepID=UPI002227EC28|nr:response regulator [Azospirillum canadense]MCW2236412.1 FixJ family two-component response regulator [Azospirillum canadense]